MTKFRYSLLAALLLGGTAPAIARTFYADPIALGNYVTDPRVVIHTGMDKFQWMVQDEQPGKILARLTHDKHKIVVAILYDDHSIRFEDVSAEAFDCLAKHSTTSSSVKPSKPVECRVDESDVERWRVSLRRGILKAVHAQALRDAETNYYALPANQRKESPSAAEAKKRRKSE